MEFSKIISRLAEAFGTMSRMQKLVVGGTIVALLLLFIASLFLGPSGRDSYRVLFDSLSPRDTARVIDYLEKEETPYRIIDEHTVEVPQERVYEERIAIASRGLLKEGNARSERFSEHLFTAATSDQKNVTLTDAKGETLGASALLGLSAIEQRFKQHEEQKREENIVKVLAPILGGSEYVVAKVTIEYDFSQKQSTSEVYNPGGVIRSEQRSETASSSHQLQKNRAVDYEISKTLTTTREDHARIKRITAAVVIDANAEIEIDEEQWLAEVTTLVKRSIGIDEKRGDQVSVRHFRFTKPQAEAAPPATFPKRERSGLITLAEPYVPLLMLLLVALIGLGLFKAVLMPFLKPAERPHAGSQKNNSFAEPSSVAAKAERPPSGEESLDMEALLAKVRAAAVRSPKEVAVLLQAMMEEENKGVKEKRIRTLRKEG